MPLSQHLIYNTLDNTPQATAEIKVLNIYNKLFGLLSPFTKLNGEVNKMQRGIVSSNGERFFWNYLDMTHSMAEAFRGTEGIRCIKATFSSGKEFLYSLHSPEEAKKEGLPSLDNYYLKLTPVQRKKYDQYAQQLISIENAHFSQKSMLEKRQELLQNLQSSPDKKQKDGN